ncbi:MAG: hypothetical protein H0T79_03285, partial [Deltaproteobacteria bacterium]|nr:hypothetical protein [Deltaproteobacteria bacterium]
LMPQYSTLLPPDDRWAIVHFVRVLQRSQSVALDELTPAQRTEAAPWLP